MPENEVSQETASLTEYQKWSALPEDQQTESAEAETAQPEKEAATVETDPESAPGVDSQDQDDEEAASPKGLKKRFKKLNGKIRDLETQLAQRAAPQEVKQALASPQPATDPQAPKEADFESYAEFIDARADYRFALAQSKKEAENAQARQATEAQQREADWKAKVAETIKRIPDYDEVLSDSEITVSQAMHEAILASDAGPSLIYHLAKNPAEAARIKALPPLKAALEMGKLEAKFAPDLEKKPTTVSKAPRPPSPVGGTSLSSDLGKEPDPKDFAAWNKWQDKKEAAEARGH